jgi:hypothetical protein
MRRSWAAAWWTGVLPLVAGVAGVLGVLWVVLVAAPPWFVPDRTLEGLKAQNEVRTTLLQGLGGVALLVGAYFTYRQVANSREQLAHSREQLQIAQQGQVTERFTRAVDQLGSHAVDVRTGGIYALERIARDSAADRATVVEVLTVFVRHHAPWPSAERPRIVEVLTGLVRRRAPVAKLQTRAPDVHAAMTVLGRAPWRDRSIELQLNDTDLRKVYLPDADLQGAFLNRAHLEGAGLRGVVLRRADLRHAHLQDAWLSEADLEGADLHDADLRGARLMGACLDGADLSGADLRGVREDAKTTWPTGFDIDRRREAGVVADRGAAGVIASGKDTATNQP